MISGILFAAVGQIRSALAGGDRIIEEEQERGVVIHDDPAMRFNDRDRRDDVERLARRRSRFR